MDTSLHHQYAAIEGDHWWFQGRRRIVASVLRRHLPADTAGARSILDVGCGTGEMVDMLREFGSVTALDAAPEAVAYCRERFGVQVDVRLATIPDGLPGGTFDLVSVFDVVEHLDDDLGAVDGLRAHLVPGGTLVATVPAFGFLWGPHDVLNDHRRRYRPAELRALLVAGGLVVDHVSCFNTWLFPVVAAVRTLRCRRSSEPRSDFRMPSPAMNRALLAVLASEAPVVAALSLPVGVSIVAVAHRPGDRQGGGAATTAKSSNRAAVAPVPVAVRPAPGAASSVGSRNVRAGRPSTDRVAVGPCTVTDTTVPPPAATSPTLPRLSAKPPAMWTTFQVP
ncbi:MAG: class I SAM-dependent methyltransferase [Actinomycetota bacterium]|nr:class I SAM-dependent methyltransferase [Actinomycetota bacterium]